ncbi:MAG: bifunctional glutamate N-acetyltransferase/amino-acid acetyltransferase ArgJ [Actinobacteria bacterium]|nr:bifunctional glutamate N-acetyltransferase/amino-acid acetyltransferase ArgJ [Actinomycetota bacterium]
MLRPVAGGVTAARGFRAGGVAAGLKPSGRRDLALVVADAPAGCAVTTTTNQVKAAPCVVTEEHARNGRARAVVVNAGNANACTGDRGLADARSTAAAVGARLGVDPTDVLVLSTGIIGVPMPMDRLLAGIGPLVGDLAGDGGDRAAEAITTTDTTVKTVAYEVRDDHGTCTVGGMAKGAGMIEPAMATMLCVLTTDAPLAGAVLRPMLRQAVARSFNRISIDACGSTNDTVALLASGASEQPPGLAALQVAIEAVCADLALAIVRDGEGTTKVGYLTVRGAATEEDAAGLARAIAGSTLFRAALHGADPNWGRILAAMGASSITFEPARVSVTCGGVQVCRFGVATAFDRGQAAAAMGRADVEVVVDLGLGRAGTTFLTADLTPDYVAENAYYTT